MGDNVTENETEVIAIVGRKEGNVLFNDALNTFYLRLYGVRHMVKEERKPAATTWATLLLATRVLLYASSHRLVPASAPRLV